MLQRLSDNHVAVNNAADLEYITRVWHGGQLLNDHLNQQTRHAMAQTIKSLLDEAADKVQLSVREDGFVIHTYIRRIEGAPKVIGEVHFTPDGSVDYERMFIPVEQLRKYAIEQLDYA